MTQFFSKQLNPIWIKIIFVICFCATLVSFLSFYHKKQECISNTLKTTEKQMDDAITDIESKLIQLKFIGDEMTEYLSSHDMSAEDLEKHIKKTGNDHPYIFGIGVAFQPHYFDKEKRLYAPYYRKNGDDMFTMVYAEDFYDYADGSHNWYELPLKHGPVWQEPYYGQASQSFLAEYTAPVLKNNKPVGVVFVNYSLSDIKDYMSLIDIGESGYFCIVSKKATCIYHPNSDLVLSQKNILKLAAEIKHTALAKAVAEVIKGKEGIIDKYTSPVSRLKGWLLYKPIELTGWSLLTVVDKNDTQLKQETIRKQSIDLSFYLLIMAVFFFFVLFKKNWIRILFSTLSIIFGISAIWFIVINSHSSLKDVISNELIISKKIKYYNSLFKKKHLESPIFIPTGLFIQSIEFKGSNNVELTGYIWQKYSHDQDIERGFIFPEATDFVSENAYTQKYNSYDVQGWYFQATIRERFDYSKFPLDRDDLWIRIWPKAFAKNIILVPDLKSYDFHNPESRPGVEASCITHGFKIAKSYFSFRTNPYNTDFGMKNNIGLKNSPELYFNIFLKRNFLNAFIAHLIPLMVVICLLYFILLMNIREKDHALNVLAACSGLFFVVIFDHIGLRKSLSASGIVYIEYFYFILYLVILAVSINSYVFAFHKDSKFIQHRDNIYVKTFFWPVVMGLLYLVTIIIYY